MGNGMREITTGRMFDIVDSGEGANVNSHSWKLVPETTISQTEVQQNLNIRGNPKISLTYFFFSVAWLT